MNAKTRYNAKTYDTLSVRIVKGDRDKIKAAAAGTGMSMAEYICAALTAYGCAVSSKVNDTTEG